MDVIFSQILKIFKFNFFKRYVQIITVRNTAFHITTTDNGLLCWQLTAQAAAHEQLQRQMLLERERFPHPHPSLVAQHEEYLR
jgi:hypothetical protein